MKKHLVIIIFILFCGSSFANQEDKKINLVCEDFSWSDVESLVSPYLDDALFTALVMQGQSSSYKTSLAATQAMDTSLPDVVKRILQSLIEADC